MPLWHVTAHTSHQPTHWRWVIYFPQVGSGPCDQPDHVRCLHSSWCSCSARPSQWAPVKGSTEEEVERLGTLVQVTNITTDPGLKWGNYYHYNYYCQVIPRCQDSCCTGEEGFPGPKRSNHHCLSQVGGSCSRLERLIQQKLKYLGLIWVQHQIPLYTPFKKRRLKINPGSGLYTAMEFHHKES